MSRIQLLPEAVASQVAAGEVVERPASVVKELVENALDAGARAIEVSVRGGGASLVRVVDDGCGMDRDDALLCLERHATSKIRTGADLAAIATLGFRGEALPSIASVSRFRLTTREPGALAGTEVIVNGGKIETVRDAGAPPGTDIEVRSLFFNLPARRKFLRAAATEAAHIEHQLRLLAIGHPGVRLLFRRDDRTVFQLPPGAQLLDRIRDLCGAAVAAELLPVAALPERSAAAAGGLRSVTGFLGRPGVSRASRADQIVFVNGRPVENPALSHALREGYHTALMKGRYPLTFLFLEVDPAAVDVNVHPAKREVRFREPHQVRAALVSAVRRTLESARVEWSRTFHQPPLPSSFQPGTGSVPAERLDLERESAPLPFAAAGLGARLESRARPLSNPGDAVAPDAPTNGIAPPAERKSTASAVSDPVGAAPFTRDPDAVPPPVLTAPKILGVLGRLYVLMENENGLVLVDQHAAHERILFEELRRRLETHDPPSQRLLAPLQVQLAPRDADWLRQHLDSLARMGIGLEPFGPGGTFKLDSLPPFLLGAERDPLALLREIIDALRAAGPGTATVSRLRLAEEMIAKTVCRHAVKAHDTLRGPELERLLADLLACELPYCCPHGRPTMIQLSYAELEKKFGRRA